MRILFTLITILFFSFNNVNAVELVNHKAVITKGEVIAFFKEENVKVIVMRHLGDVYECEVWGDNFICKRLKKF